MKISQEVELDLCDVLLLPNRSTISSRANVNIEREFEFYHSPKKWSGFPLICSNMASIAGFDMALALSNQKMITCLHKYISVDEYKFVDTLYEDGGTYIWPSIGFSSNEKEKLRKISKYFHGNMNICIDVPSAYIEEFIDYCREIREEFPDSIIMAGNVVCGSQAQELIIHGKIDIVKGNIGSGHNCSTRVTTGIGRPSLSTALDITSAVHGLKSAPKKLGLYCFDGGIANSGDLCKAWAAGSDFAMSAKLFSGTSECCGEWEYTTKLVPCIDHGHSSCYDVKEKAFLKHYGMSTHYAQEKHGGGKKEYRASEGVLSKIPHCGPVQNVIKEIKGGVRSCLSYLGCEDLKSISRCARFVRVNEIHQNYGSQILGF